MRVKKQKRHRKIVRFYTACFGFRHPYKVICDGTFIHHLLQNQITPADNALANTLAAPVKLFTTKCVIEELKRLGQSHSEALEAAHKLTIARCEHDKKMSADACLLEVIGDKNPEHFFIATQDVDLRKKFQEVPPVPLIFGLRNALLLEPPSATQRQFVKASEENRTHMSEKEYNMLKKRTKNTLENDENNDLSNEDEDLGEKKIEVPMEKKKHTASKGLGLKDRPQFKRKKAKGPNPLSCKKKKVQKNSNICGNENKDGNTNVRSRSRKRKRSRGSKNPAVTDS